MALLTILTGAPITPPPPPPPPEPPYPVEPATTPALLGGELAQRLAPLYIGEDQADRLLESLAVAVMEPLEEHHAVAIDTDLGGDGWSVALAPDLAPPGSLRWLAQWTGAPSTPGVTRQQIKDHQVMRRGRPVSITTAVAATLVRSRTVMLTERYQGSAYRLLVQVYAADTPDPVAAEAAARGQVPVGVRMVFEVLLGMTVGQAEQRFATVGDVEAAFPTVAESEAFTP